VGIKTRTLAQPCLGWLGKPYRTKLFQACCARDPDDNTVYGEGHTSPHWTDATRQFRDCWLAKDSPINGPLSAWL